MAIARIEVYDGRAERLPPVCLKCGAEATDYEDRKFSWYPPWTAALLVLGVLPAAIVMLALTRRASAEVPFCDRHRRHWLKRNLIVGLSLLALVGVFVLGVVLVNQPPPLEDVGGAVLALSGLGLVAWIITAAVVGTTTIRPVEITATSLRLTGAAPAFIDALEEEGAAPGALPPLSRDAEERWNQRRERGERRDDGGADADRVRRPRPRRPEDDEDD